MELNEIELKINEMCDLLGLSAQGIRLYEKQGAIHSFKLEENGYRYYYFEDIGPAIQARSMRKMGIPLSDCSKSSTGQNLEEMEHSLSSCRRQIEENIRYEQALFKRIDEMEAAAKWAVSHLHEFRECVRPEMEYLLCEKDGMVLKDRVSRKLIREWSECFPFVQFCPMVPQNELECDPVSKIGFCFFKGDHRYGPEIEHPQVIHLPEECCIGGVIRVSRTATDYLSVVQPGLSYMEREGYELTGDIRSVLLMAGIEENGEIFDYYYGWYPCRKA